MPRSELRLIKRCAELLPMERIHDFPRRLRGIYVLYMSRPKAKKFDVVYVGMASTGIRGGIKGRISSHSKKKGSLWTHFSVFEVWDNIRDEEVKELEGIFRHIYRKDSQANKLNVQRGFRKIKRIRKNDPRLWHDR
jgi:hypothetical protein